MDPAVLQVALGAGAIAGIMGLLKVAREFGEVMGFVVTKSDAYAKDRIKLQQEIAREHMATRELIRDFQDQVRNDLKFKASREDILRLKGRLEGRLGILEHDHGIKPPSSADSGEHEGLHL